MNISTERTSGTNSKVSVACVVVASMYLACASVVCACVHTPVGDLNGDCVVEWADFGIFAANWQVNCNTDPANRACQPPGTPDGMVYIPAGVFQMGDTFNEGSSSELPVHTVNTDAFYMGMYEVTNQEYADALNWANRRTGAITVIDGVVYKYNSGTSYPYCDTNSYDGDSRITWDGSTFGVIAGKEDHPMIGISWYGAVAYCNWLSLMEGLTSSYDLTTWTCDYDADGYRLPTEAEREKAARGGSSGHRFPWSDKDTIQHRRANYNSSTTFSYDTSPTRGYHPDFDDGGYPYTSPVGYFAPNDYGLYDVAGNVWEWCHDWYDSSYYSSSPTDNPQGPSSGTYRVLRGGGWLNKAAYFCRSAVRDYLWPDNRRHYGGFRISLDSE